MAERRTVAVASLLLPASLLLALTLRTLDYGFVWMDESEIVERHALLSHGDAWFTAFLRPLHVDTTGAAGAGAGSNPYYRPLQVLLFTAVESIAGPDPRVFRALSLAFGCALLTAFTGLARGLFGAAQPAVIAGCLVAAHPSVLEAVVWISGTSEVLSDLLLVVGLGAGLRFIGPTPALGGDARRAAGFVSVLALALALLTKEKAVVLPVLMLAAAACRSVDGWGGRAAATGPEVGEAARRERALLLVMAAVTLAYLLARPLLAGVPLGASAPIGGHVTTHLLSAVAAWPGSLGWLFWPASSSTSDVIEVVTSFASLRAWLGVGVALASLAAVAALLRARLPVAAFGLLWVWIAFLPTSSLLPQMHARAERYLFLSAFGAALLVTDLLRTCASRLPEAARSPALALVATVLVGGLAQRSAARAPAWESTRTLFGADVAADPRFREGRQHLALSLFREGRLAEADAHLRVLVDDPARFAGSSSYVNPVGLHQLVCETRLGLGRAAEAEAHVTRLRSSDPRIAAQPGIRACHAESVARQGRTEQALALYLALVADLPVEPPPELSLRIAAALADLGRTAEASDWLERAQRSAPADPAFLQQLLPLERRLRAERARSPS